MTVTAPRLPAVALANFERCDHPIVRGEFPALVFSGDTEALGELPGEITAATLCKFALADERLPAQRDFARTPHMPLPIWPANRLQPIDGVCFVLSDQQHPAIERLRFRGGIEDEHFVIAANLSSRSGEWSLSRQLCDLMCRLPVDGVILLLGFGDQGARIAALLCMQFQCDPARLAVIDDNIDSRRRARAANHSVIDDVTEVSAAAVIYTPLMRYERLYNLFEAQRRKALAIDNSMPNAGALTFDPGGAFTLNPPPIARWLSTGRNCDCGPMVCRFKALRWCAKTLAGWLA